MRNFLFAFFLTCCYCSDAQHFQRHIRYLTSDSLHGRASGTADERRAADYIAAFMKDSCGALITRQRFTFQADSLHSTDTATNIISVVDHHAPETIILCAHYDGLGRGSGHSLELFPREVHPGADDNASGVALMLELARWIHGQHIRRYNFIFLATSAHELGLYGAKHFVGTHFTDTMHVSAVFNFDMVGRLDILQPTLRVTEADRDPVRENIFDHDKGKLNLRYDNAQNDYTVFKEHHYHAYSFTTGTHDDYHRHTDTEDKINYPGMMTIYEFMRSVINDWQ